MDAVIDIGSNSVRLAYLEGDGVHPKQVETTFLAEGLAQSGALSPAAIDRTAKAIFGFFTECAYAGVDQIYIFGTEALRSGSNAMDLVYKVKQQTGLSIDIIDGKTEALCGFLGANPKKNAICVVDIGGASIELAQGKELIEDSKSLPLGVTRVQDLCKSDREQTRAYYAQQIKAFPLFTSPLVGIGGTATSLAAMHLRLDPYDPKAVHNCVLKLDDLIKLEDEIYSYATPAALSQAFPSLGEARAKVIGTGCIALIEIMRYLQKKEISVSEGDNVEGYHALQNGKKA